MEAFLNLLMWPYVLKNENRPGKGPVFSEKNLNI